MGRDRDISYKEDRLSNVIDYLNADTTFKLFSILVSEEDSRGRPRNIAGQFIYIIAENKKNAKDIFNKYMRDKEGKISPMSSIEPVSGKFHFDSNETVIVQTGALA